jgi:hypothetical protein
MHREPLSKSPDRQRSPAGFNAPIAFSVDWTDRPPVTSGESPLDLFDLSRGQIRVKGSKEISFRILDSPVASEFTIRNRKSKPFRM